MTQQVEEKTVRRGPSIAEYYHAETDYTPEKLTRLSEVGPAGEPVSPFKPYPGECVSLARLRGPGGEADWLTGKDPAPGADDPFARLSRLLYLANGVTRVVSSEAGPLALRAAPSAGGLYPTEIYLAVRAVPGLAPGLYNYQVQSHSLVTLRTGGFWPTLEAAALGQEVVALADLVLVLTLRFDRGEWRYRQRAYRRALLDTGHVLGNIVLAAPRLGWTACPLGGFRDAELEELFELDEDQEGLALMVPLLPAALNVAFRPALGSNLTPAREALLDAGVMRALHRAARIHQHSLPPTLPRGRDLPESAHLEDRHGLVSGLPLKRGEDWPAEQAALFRAIVKRRSCRDYSGLELSFDVLERLLACAYPEGPRGGFCGGFIDRHLLETYVIALAVRGLEGGIYYYAPLSHSLRQLRVGEARRACHQIGLGQDICRDAAFLVVHTTDLPRALEKYGDRTYRYLGLDAGHIGQRLNLGAVLFGHGASGIGGYLDHGMREILGLDERQAVVYITTVGAPSKEA